jgi:hypothetical protein
LKDIFPKEKHKTGEAICERVMLQEDEPDRANIVFIFENTNVEDLKDLHGLVLVRRSQEWILS